MQVIREKTCCFSGHRRLPKDQGLLEQRLEETIIQLIEKGVIYFYAGGALGFDMLAEKTVIRLKKTYPNIQLFLALPCVHHEAKWKDAAVEQFKRITRKADRVIYTSTEHYFDGCMQQRNRYMVDRSGICVCYLHNRASGTGYTVDYARKKGLPVFNLYDNLLRYTLNQPRIL